MLLKTSEKHSYAYLHLITSESYNANCNFHFFNYNILNSLLYHRTRCQVTLLFYSESSHVADECYRLLLR